MKGLKGVRGRNGLYWDAFQPLSHFLQPECWDAILYPVSLQLCVVKDVDVKHSVLSVLP